MLSLKDGTIKILPGNKRPWLARIRAYTPQAAYDLEREWVRLEASGQVALAQLAEGVYEYCGKERGFFAYEGGRIVPLDKAQAVARLGTALDPRAEKKAELRRLEREMERWIRLDRRYSDGDGMFDWCNEREVEQIQALEARIRALREELDAKIGGHEQT